MLYYTYLSDWNIYEIILCTFEAIRFDFHMYCNVRCKENTLILKFYPEKRENFLSSLEIIDEFSLLFFVRIPLQVYFCMFWEHSIKNNIFVILEKSFLSQNSFLF